MLHQQNKATDLDKLVFLSVVLQYGDLAAVTAAHDVVLRTSGQLEAPQAPDLPKDFLADKRVHLARVRVRLQQLQHLACKNNLKYSIELVSN